MVTSDFRLRRAVTDKQAPGRSWWRPLLCSILCGLLFLCASPPLAATARTTPARVFLNAKAAVVIDADSGRVIYAKQADTPFFPASTTKLMTALLLTEVAADSDLIYVGSEAARQPKVRLGLRPGTTLTAEEALHALLMKSANDVAYAVAQSIGGSQEGFARMMNVKARTLGCTHTHFVTPNGLHDDRHVSSAHDIARILQAALQRPAIVAALQTREYRVAGKSIRNGNRLIYVNHTAFGETVGGKTGYTSKAMYCLAFSARTHGRVYISVVLGAPRKSAMYRETRRLLEWAAAGKQVQLV